jgi:hypothetical protein
MGNTVFTKSAEGNGVKHKFTIFSLDIVRVRAIPRYSKPEFERLSGQGIKKRFLPLFRRGDQSDIHCYMMKRIECGSDHPPATRDQSLFRHGSDVGGVVKSVLDYIVFELHRSSPGSLSTCNDVLAGWASKRCSQHRQGPGKNGSCGTNDWQHSARLQGLSGRIPVSFLTALTAFSGGNLQLVMDSIL